MADKEFEYSVNFPAGGLHVNNFDVCWLESGKVPLSLLPDTVVGAVQYKGAWDCSGAAYPTSPEAGDYYICSVAGTISGTYYAVGDWLVYNGTTWDKIDATQELDDTPQDGVTTHGVTSNWAYDHSQLTNNASLPAHVPTVPADPTTKFLNGNNQFVTLPATTQRQAIDGRLSGSRERVDLDGDLEAFILKSDDEYVAFRFRIPFGFDVSKVLRINFGACWEGNEATGANFKLETYVRRTTFAVAPTTEDLAVPSGNEDIKLALYKDYAGSTFQVGDEVKIKLYKPTGLTVQDLAIHQVSGEVRDS